MKSERLKQEAFEANLLLAKYGLITLTWGNVSAIDREQGLVIIKPSGVEYAKMRVEDMVVTDTDGNILEGSLRPSSDLATHLALYKAFEGIGGIVHTHSACATSFAQAGRGIPCYGTTHADYFFGTVPCTRPLSREEILSAYEEETGKVIAEIFLTSKIDPLAVPAALVNKHGPFTWGVTASKAVETAVVLEECARIALMTESLNADVAAVEQTLMDKHYFRKHGVGAYYGQVSRAE